MNKVCASFGRVRSTAIHLRLRWQRAYAGDVRDVTSANFGLLIAFVLPGFILLWGTEPYSATVQGWMGRSTPEQASVGGFLYVTVASVGMGQLVSTIRWLVVDTILYRTGVPRPKWNFRRLKDSVAAFEQLIEIHYRYYQWHANSLVALTIAVVLRWIAEGFSWTQLSILITVDALLFAGSRDTLSKYHHRVEELLYRRR